MRILEIKNLMVWFFLLFFVCQVISQTKDKKLLEPSTRMAREFTLDKEDLSHEIKISFQEDLKKVAFDFSGEIESGNLELKIKDPNGKYEGGFSLKRNKESDLKNRNATGNFQKSVNNPLKGTWLIEIKAIGVKGKFKIVMIEELSQR